MTEEAATMKKLAEIFPVKITRKKVLCIIIPAIIIFLIINYFYYIKQGIYLFAHQYKAENIDQLLEKKDLPEKMRDFFTLVKDIKKYAVNEIGLRSNNNYACYVDIEKPYLIDLVTAARPDSFEPHTWHTLLGSFPYRGFYEREDAKEEARRLEQEGYDVYIFKTRAFSTMGILTDPIFSYMQNYTIYDLANIIIHEQTHATIFLKSRIQFNEELATFTGREGALVYIRDKYGKESKAYKDSLVHLEDMKTFAAMLRKLCKELKLQYAKDISRQEKLKRKKAILSRFQKDFTRRYDSNFKTSRYRKMMDIKLNNAYLHKFLTYNEDFSLLTKLYKKHNSNLKKMIGVLKTKLEALEDYSGGPKDLLVE